MISHKTATLTPAQRQQLFSMLNELDDARERRLKAASTGRSEPVSMYGGLYTIDEVDDNLIERSDDTGFIPVGEIHTRMGYHAPLKRKRDAAPARKRRAGSEWVPCVFRRMHGGLVAVAGIAVPYYL